MEKEYTVNNHLCDGLTPAAVADNELLEFQKRLISDSAYRAALNFNIEQAMGAVVSRVPMSIMEIYISEVASYMMKLLMNDSVVPKVYTIVPHAVLEDAKADDLPSLIALTAFTADEQRELPWLSGGFNVFSGKYVIKAESSENYEIAEEVVTIEPNDERNTIVVELVLKRKPIEPSV